jgi:hypothetical protein
LPVALFFSVASDSSSAGSIESALPLNPVSIVNMTTMNHSIRTNNNNIKKKSINIYQHLKFQLQLQTMNPMVFQVFQVATVYDNFRFFFQTIFDNNNIKTSINALFLTIGDAADNNND